MFGLGEHLAGERARAGGLSHVVDGGEVAGPGARAAVLAVVGGALVGKHRHDKGGALGDEVAEIGEHFCAPHLMLASFRLTVLVVLKDVQASVQWQTTASRIWTCDR